MKFGKISFFLSSLALATSAFAYNPIFRYNYAINVINNLGEAGYFNVCEKPVHEGSQTLCALPQPIKEGANLLYVPYFKTPHPTFTTGDENTYTCGTATNDNAQLYVTGRTIVLKSYIMDKDNNKVALDCGIPTEKKPS